MQNTQSRKLVAEDKIKIFGYCLRFNQWGGSEGRREMIVRSALPERASLLGNVRICVNHSIENNFGSTAEGNLDLVITSQGLYFSIIPTGDFGEFVAEQTLSGDIQYASCGIFQPDDLQERTEAGTIIRKIEGIDEISLLCGKNPMYKSCWVRAGKTEIMYYK
jgi:phage head maturation protease